MAKQQLGSQIITIAISQNHYHDNCMGKKCQLASQLDLRLVLKHLTTAEIK